MRHLRLRDAGYCARSSPRHQLESDSIPVRASDHHDGRKFTNPSGQAGQPFSKVPRMLREPRKRWPTHVDVDAHVPPPLDGSAAVVTYVGHATFLIQTRSGNL